MSDRQIRTRRKTAGISTSSGFSNVNYCKLSWTARTNLP